MKKWEEFVKKKLIKFPEFEEGLTEDLLHFLEGYGLVRISVRKDSKFAEKEIGKLDLRKRGVIVLGIEREGKWIHTPDRKEKLLPDDRIVVYGPLSTLKKLGKEK